MRIVRSFFVLIMAGSALAWGLAGCGGSGGGDACAAFFTKPTASTVTVELVNKTASNLYFGDPMPAGCGEFSPLSLMDSSGHALGWSVGSCSFTCKEVRDGACACTNLCAQPTVRLVVPGGKLEILWGGTVFTSEKMPAECLTDMSCGTNQCLVEGAPPNGITFASSAWTDIVGQCGGMMCTCTPDANGTCVVGGGINMVAVGGTELQASTKVSGAPGASVEIDFQ